MDERKLQLNSGTEMPIRHKSQHIYTQETSSLNLTGNSLILPVPTPIKSRIYQIKLNYLSLRQIISNNNS